MDVTRKCFPSVSAAVGLFTCSAKNVRPHPPPTQKSFARPLPAMKPRPHTQRRQLLVRTDTFVQLYHDRPLLSVFIDIFSTIFASFALQLVFSCAVTSEAYRSVAEARGWKGGGAEGPRGAGSDLTRRRKRRGARKMFPVTLDFARAPVVMVFI